MVKKNKDAKIENHKGDEFRMVREVVESLAVALVLAFLFKLFLVELFVIPTGSMAPTLMGFHKDVICTTCGYEFPFSASEEFPEAVGQGRRSEHAVDRPLVLGGTCPQCGFTMYVGKDNTTGKDYRSYPGDRILVSKYNYEFRAPRRWNVTVFRYPGKAQVSYIKRLVGLENETIRIQNGDIFVKKAGENEFHIQRKPSRPLHAMLQLVYDNDYAVPAHHKLGWPTRWGEPVAETDAKTGDVWSVSDDYRSFTTEGRANADMSEEADAAVPDSAVPDSAAPEDGWLVYRHFIPSSHDCWALGQNMPPDDLDAVRPQLITDFNPYNSGLVNNPAEIRRSASDLIIPREVMKDGNVVQEKFCQKDPDTVGLNWVGDLVLSCELTTPASPPSSSPPSPKTVAPRFQARLVKGARTFLCSIDLVTGTATLSIPGVEAFPPVSATTPVRLGRSHRVQFGNLDEQLRLWVDGKEIAFENGAVYDHLCEGGDAVLPRTRSPNRLDLAPAGIHVRGTSATVAHLKLMRDLYYIACDRETRSLTCDLLRPPFYLFGSGGAEQRNARVLSTPELWDAFGKTRVVDFPLEKDQFLLLGDNSARSQDSRLWDEGGIPPYVPRDLLVGEAILVYWPHGLPIPGLPLNWIPNFPQMRFID